MYPLIPIIPPSHRRTPRRDNGVRCLGELPNTWRSDLSRTHRGVITPPPPVFMRHPQPSVVQRGLSGGCLRGCLCDRDGRGNKQ